MAGSDSDFAAMALALGDERTVPDVGWVAELAAVPTPRAASALREMMAFRPIVDSVGASLRAGGRGFYASICAPFELFALTRLLRPAHIVETGVSSGVSSTHWLLGLRQNGRGVLHSVDLPTRQKGATLAEGESPVSLPPGRDTGWAIPAELRAGWDLRAGSTQERLGPLLDELPAVDLFLHDDLHEPDHVAWELRLLRPKLHPGSVVLADNTEWSGTSFPDFARSFGTEARARRGSDLLGFRVPEPPTDGTRPAAPPGRRGRP